jgi:hypothetical protein
MTSRERVLRCLEFDHPDRVPRQLWCLPIAGLCLGNAAIAGLEKRFPGDIGGPRVPPPATLDQGNPYALGTYRDEWGCVWESIQAGVVGEVKHPMVDDWSHLDRVHPPEAMLKLDVAAINRACAAQSEFLMSGCCPRPFERIQFLRGSENVYLDLAEEPAEFFELLKIIHDYNCREAEAWCATDVDGLSFMDDWGSQRALLISPDQWRRIFKPLYRDYCAIAKARGKKVFMHSDGYIFDIYPDLIEIGVDAVNSQLFCMDIEEIGRRFKGKITFWGEIDRQHILPHGTVAETRAAVGRVAKALYDPAGGVIAQFELGAAASLDNAVAIFDEWDKIGAHGAA